MNVSIFHDMTCKLPVPGLLEGVADLIRTDEKLAVFTQSYRQTGSKTFKNESQLFAVPCRASSREARAEATSDNSRGCRLWTSTMLFLLPLILPLSRLP